MHGPCGVRCQDEAGKCKKKFPKPYAEATTLHEDGSVVYRRRRGPPHVQNPNAARPLIRDSRWVVPYNPYFATKYNCHINFEVVNGMGAIKYLYKYVYKGPDQAQLKMSERAIRRDPDGTEHIDETVAYEDARYISASEASYHFAGGPMHGEAPTIYRLGTHLPGEQMQEFGGPESSNIQELLTVDPETQLTGWFKSNIACADGRHLLYADYCQEFSWNQPKKAWTRRVREHAQGRPAIGRIYTVWPSAGERYMISCYRQVIYRSKSDSSSKIPHPGSPKTVVHVEQRESVRLA